ncbi:maltose O-acetyltransferase [Thiogranum longum]|uniref:Maltose O-acetyltransferase n=1 Tax=Thiogranum longum TaxID=1537524 RepID=A0A4R1HD72_9GAMM|nr:acyltransferase [Thiogranum longum]TCK18100.1 maltose O-acetyltransferase [Thiogranum longum]
MNNILENSLISLFRLVWRFENISLVRRAFIYLRWIKWGARLGSIGKKSKICPYVVIRAPKNVFIGSGVVIAEFVHVWGGGGVIIGDNVIIASHVAITSQTHDILSNNYRDSAVMSNVTIESNVWIGSGVTVLPGVRIGRNSIVGAGAVVTRDVPENVVVAGIPAKILRKLN